MSTKPSLDELFDQRHTYPDIDSRTRLERLILKISVGDVQLARTAGRLWVCC